MAESNKDDKFCKRIDFSSGNLSTAWKSFKMQFEVFKVAKKYSDMSDEEQISNMLVQMGNESVPIYAQFVYDDSKESQKKTLTNTIRMFDEYFEPVKNVIYERAKFNTMRQGEKSIHQFIVELQNQADQCDYGTMKSDLIRDRIVVGVKDKKLREYLMDIDDLDLNKCIQKSKQWVSNHQQTSKFDDVEDENAEQYHLVLKRNSLHILKLPNVLLGKSHVTCVTGLFIVVNIVLPNSQSVKSVQSEGTGPNLRSARKVQSL